MAASNVWNTITNALVLEQTYPNGSIAVDREGLKLVENMHVLESTIASALDRIMDSLDVDAADFDADADPDEGVWPMYAVAFYEHAPEQLRVAILHLLLYGFVAFRESKRSVVNGKHNVPVSVVADPSTYVPYICITAECTTPY